MLETIFLHSLEVHLSFRGRKAEVVHGPADEHQVFAVDRECLPIPACQRLGIRLRGNQRNREIEKAVTGACDVWVHNAFRKSKRYPWLMEGSPGNVFSRQ